jgi:CHASE2 domain-containing sensor protein
MDIKKFFVKFRIVLYVTSCIILFLLGGFLLLFNDQIGMDPAAPVFLIAFGIIILFIGAMRLKIYSRDYAKPK